MRRHLIVTAHPDDESLSCAALLCRGEDVRLFQLTTGVPVQSEGYDAHARRRARERAAALVAGEWASIDVVDGHVSGRAAHRSLEALLVTLRGLLASCEQVYTHPYENGHLDHDTAAWLVQTACAEMSQPPRRMEFASYHATHGADVFGRFWPDMTRVEEHVILTSRTLARKHAALAAYASQARILAKFPDLTREVYRVPPVYDFSQPAPPPVSRWDRKGYQPSTAEWRQAVAAQTVAA